MQNIEQIRKLLGKKVTIGTPHFYDPNRLWFYNGTLKSVSLDSIELLTASGKTVILELNRVMQIEEADY